MRNIQNDKQTAVAIFRLLNDDHVDKIRYEGDNYP